MRLESVQPNRFAFVIGYLLSYSIATTMLFLILIVWRDVPWTLMHIIAITGSIAIAGRAVARWLG